MNKILQFVQSAIANPENSNDEINFGVMPNFQAQEINRITGVITRTGLRTMTNYAVNHTIKGHGVEAEKKRQALLPVGALLRRPFPLCRPQPLQDQIPQFPL